MSNCCHPRSKWFLLVPHMAVYLHAKREAICDDLSCLPLLCGPLDIIAFHYLAVTTEVAAHYIQQPYACITSLQRPEIHANVLHPACDT
uniref:Uncharacterized protein n=1 Tax=Arundo donax TaxID=35708 RepID=A0A0A8XUZ3_ARUDO